MFTIGFGYCRDVGTSGSEKANVSSPNVLMKITDKDGEDLVAANVGDALSLRFEILEKDSEYQNVKAFQQNRTNGTIPLIKRVVRSV